MKITVSTASGTTKGVLPRSLDPRLIPDRLSRLINATVGVEDQKPVETAREPPVVGHSDDRALEGIQAQLQRLGGLQVEIVGRLVKEQQRRAAQLEQQDLEAGLLTSRQRLESLLGR